MPHASDFAALQGASRNGDIDRVRALLDAGVDPNADPGMPHGMSPLMLAAWQGHAEVARLLIERGADVHREDGDGFTAMTLAAKRRAWEIVEMLARAGVDPNHADASGVSALRAAEQARQSKLLKVLREQVREGR